VDASGSSALRAFGFTDAQHGIETRGRPVWLENPARCGNLRTRGRLFVGESPEKVQSAHRLNGLLVVDELRSTRDVVYMPRSVVGVVAVID
jgi:hypothetical protein